MDMNEMLRRRGRRKPTEHELRVERVLAGSGWWEILDADAAAKMLDWDVLGDDPDQTRQAVEELMRLHPTLGTWRGSVDAGEHGRDPLEAGAPGEAELVNRALRTAMRRNRQRQEDDGIELSARAGQGTLRDGLT